MNSNKFILAGIAGGIVYFLLGWLIYGILLSDFMKSNAGSATGVDREEMVYWSLIVGNLFSGFLLSYIFTRLANISTAGGGAMAGAVVGLLVCAGFDFTMYGVSNLTTLTGLIVDILAFTVLSAIAGAVVGAVAGSGKKGATA